MITVEMKKKIEDALAKANERIRWAANLYGARYGIELEFLEPCRDAINRLLELIDKYKLHEPDDYPTVGVSVLVYYDGKKHIENLSEEIYKHIMKEHCVCIGRHLVEDYGHGEVQDCWKLDLTDEMEDIEVIGWRELPERWE